MRHFLPTAIELRAIAAAVVIGAGVAASFGLVMYAVTHGVAL